MSTMTGATLYTPEDLLLMPDGDQFELVDGQLVEREMGMWSSYVAGRAHYLLTDFVESRRGRGWVLPGEAGYQCFPDAPGKVRKPDVSFIRFHRRSPEAVTEEGYIRI